MGKKRVLIISNNALSLQNNNGKTLESFFQMYPTEKLAQLYFSEEKAVSNVCNNFYKISDQELVRKILGKRVKQSSVDALNGSPQKEIKVTEGKRLLRELMWRSCFWKTDNLKKWINDFQPEIIFFCGGDSGFAYNITKYIKKITGAKLILFLTDDYVVNKANHKLLYLIRHRYIKKKMMQCIKSTDQLITISEKMSKVYKEKFGKDSLVLVNMSEEICKDSKVTCGEIVKCVYLGGFEYNRDKILLELGYAMEKYNAQNDDKKFVLEIFSNNNSAKAIIERLRKCTAIYWGGRLNAEEVKTKIIEADILIHVESFDQYAKAKTGLSMSTKIPEYLSAKRLILAIGPHDIASIEYLNNAAVCVYKEEGIYGALDYIIKHENVWDEKINNAIQLYNEKHKPSVVRRCFETMLEEL